MRSVWRGTSRMGMRWISSFEPPLDDGCGGIALCSSLLETLSALRSGCGGVPYLGPAKSRLARARCTFQ